MPRKATTRAAHGSISTNQRPNGTWRGRYTMDGKRHDIYGKTEREVMDKWADICKDVRNGTYVKPSSTRLSDWLDTYLTDFARGIRDTTRLQYAKNFKNHTKPALGNTRLDQLRPDMIQRFYNSLERDKGLSPKTVKNIHGALHKALEKAVNLGYIPANPSDAGKIELSRVVHKVMKPFDIPEFRIYQEAVKGARYEAALYIMPWTGMREAETIGLKWSDIDYKKRTITISRQLICDGGKGVAAYFSPPKNGKMRTIHPGANVFEALKRHEIAQKKTRLKAGMLWHEGEYSGLVFTNSTGRYVDSTCVWRSFKNVLAKAQLEDRRVHDLRHTFPVIGQAAGLSIKAISETLGHASVAFTLDIYGSFLKTEREESAVKLDEFARTLS